MTRFAHTMVVAFAGGLIALSAQAPAPTPSREDLVKRFVAAFNNHDLYAMVAMVTDDVEWLSVDGRTVDRETEGKTQLRTSMAARGTLNAVAPPGTAAIVGRDGPLRGADCDDLYAVAADPLIRRR